MMKHFARSVVAAAAFCIAIPAVAQTSQQSAQSVAIAKEADTANAGMPFDAPVVDSADLSTVTGKADLATVISAKNTSNVSNNSVSGNSVTGSIDFDQSSFSGLNGLSLLSANTGNNVAINSSLNVNVVIRP